jgi:demethylmenaquinone methyltransferase / 2-methoxy-6-polyprenyl-1,4-benzoquinol methylase
MALNGSSVLPAPEAKGAFVRDLFERIAPRYDLMNRVLTFGLDQRWRRALVRGLELPRGARVLDLATGTGDLIEWLSAVGARPIGADLARAMLTRAAQRHPGRPFLQADGAFLPFASASVDAITCGFALRNFHDLDGVLRECARILRPGGQLAILEVDRPALPGIRELHALYFRHVVPQVGALLSDARAYKYLPESTAFLPEHERLREMLHDAGFDSLDKKTHMLGAVQALRARRVR